VSRTLEFVFIGGSIAIIFGDPLPMEEFGLTLRNYKRSLYESLGVTIPLLLLTLFIKYQLLTRTALFPDGKLISLTYFDGSYLVYLLIAPLQEFIARGVFQEALHRLIASRYNSLWAILITSLLFGAFHIHQSISLAFLAITMGIIWGGLYLRHRTLIGIALSHFLIGTWLGILGLWDLMSRY
jgi:hypothetical protein